MYAANTPLFKVTGPAGECLNGGAGQWPIPSGDEPGLWWEVTGEISPCRNGLHLVAAEHLDQWTPNGREYIVWRAEARGEIVDGGQKVAVRAARLLRAVDLAGYHVARAALQLAESDANTLKNTAEYVAREKRDRANRRAAAKTVSRFAGVYIAAISYQKLPAGHPLAAKITEYRAAEEAYNAAIAPAARSYGRAVRRAERAYQAAVAPHRAAVAAALEEVKA